MGRALFFILTADGLAISHTFEHGRFVRVLSRGNGSKGADPSANVRALPDVPASRRASSTPPPEIVELRGEIYLPKIPNLSELDLRQMRMTP